MTLLLKTLAANKKGEAMDDQIQQFLGWLLALDHDQFSAALERAGHGNPAYRKEKWAEFQNSPLAFAWNWTPELVAAWSAPKQPQRQI